MTRAAWCCASARGTALFAVLVVVMLGVGVALSATRESASAVVAANGDAFESRARLAARSELSRLLAQMRGQRDELLAGGTPGLEIGSSPYADLRLSLREIGADGEVVLAEAACFPVHSGISAPVVEGGEDAGVPSAPEVLARVPLGESDETGWFTACTWDPALTAGVRGEAGLERLDLLSTSDADAIDVLGEILGTDKATAVWSGDGTSSGPEDFVDLLARLEQASVEPDEWGALVDRVVFGSVRPAGGKVDLNRAPAQVLAMLPGLSSDVAQQLVDERSTLAPGEAASVTWPLTRGVVDRATFAAFASYCTSRSLQWRVVVEVRRVEGSAGSPDDEPRAPLLAIEAVLDVGGRVPRLALVRDITHAPEAWLGRSAESELLDDTVTTAQPELSNSGDPTRPFLSGISERVSRSDASSTMADTGASPGRAPFARYGASPSDRAPTGGAR